MLKNYFKTAWRNITRSKGYSALNIAGLAIGMAVTLIIGLWVHKEYTYDKFLPGYDRLYLARRNYYGNGDTVNYASASLKLADAFRRQIPEIEYVAETDYMSPHVLTVGDKKLSETGGQMGSDFLKMFQFPLLSGNRNELLNDPYSIVLTESLAKALFGNMNPINKTIRLDDKNDMKVTGVLKDIPNNSSFQFDFLVPFSYYEATTPMVKIARSRNFQWNGFQIFVKLKRGVSYAQIKPKIKNIEKSETDNQMSMTTDVLLQPMGKWHLYEKYENGKAVGGFIEYIRIFSIIGILVLLIACVNFVNLTTARSEKRAHEVGVRKAIGSRRKDLVLQFLLESAILTGMAFVICLVIAELALPAFNMLTGSKISIPYSNIYFWIVAMAGVIITALAAGARPAFYLSSFNPVKVLKGKLTIGDGSAWPRKILVIIQFSCSVALIIGSLIIYQQIQYAKDRPTGMNVNRLMMTNLNGSLGQNFQVVKDELIQKGIAESVTMASSSATQMGMHRDVEQWPGKKPGETVDMGQINVSDDYFKTLGMSMKEGRDFRNNSDSLNVIANEAAIKLMRLKDPINQIITFGDDRYKIVGVVKDALMASPFAPADPTLYFHDNDPQRVMMYRLSHHIKTQDAITKLTVIFNKYNPAFPYTYTFSDQSYAAKFSLEILIGKLAGLFAALAIFISCLGLFGLAAYIAEQRNKEIGIRKVLGASVSQVWFLLSKEFILLVFISCAIASPIAFYFLQGWLEKYSYRITIGVGVFFWAALLAITITLVTISLQAIKAAITNPVESLRTE
jgi:putative ABC transport system permease protein